MFNDPNMAWGNPYVSPNESYFIFSSSRPGGFGGTDLYISYKKNNGSWTNPKNLGNIINTATSESGSEITDDTLYMTFVSNNNIYWVGSDFIDSLRYTNFTPYVLNPIPNQTAIKGEWFTFTIPDSTFIDDDGQNTLTYHAKLTSGNPLPAWLTFDTIAGTFAGTPAIIETLNIKVTASDTAGASVSTTFKITVNNPVLVEQVNGQDESVKIYPNPTSGLITISPGTFSGKNAMVEIRNPEGKVVLLKSQENINSIDLTGKPKGVYILKLFNDREMIVRKVVLNN
jgi:hypothetical protein